MGRLLPEDVEPRNLSPLALAFVGDGVYELMVRERLARQATARSMSCISRRWPWCAPRPRPRPWTPFSPG